MEDFSFIQLAIIFVSIIVIFYAGYIHGYVKGTLHTMQKNVYSLRKIVNTVENNIIKIYVVQDENNGVSIYRSSDDGFLAYALSFADISTELYAAYPDDSKVYVIDKIKKTDE